MRPWATSVSPSRSFFMLLAAKMARPLSKKIVFTARPDCTWRSPLRRPAASWRSGSAIGVTERSVSITADLGYHGGRRRHNPAPRTGYAVPQDQAGRAPAAPAGTGQRDADRVPARRGVEQHQLARRGKLGLGARPSFQPGFRVPPSAASDVELQLAPGEPRGIAQLQLDPGDRDLAAELEAQEVARALELLRVPPRRGIAVGQGGQGAGAGGGRDARAVQGNEGLPAQRFRHLVGGDRRAVVASPRLELRAGNQALQCPWIVAVGGEDE